LSVPSTADHRRPTAHRRAGARRASPPSTAWKRSGRTSVRGSATAVSLPRRTAGSRLPIATAPWLSPQPHGLAAHRSPDGLGRGPPGRSASQRPLIRQDFAVATSHEQRSDALHRR